MNNQILQHHLDLAVDMSQKQLCYFSTISEWDLNYTLFRVITNQFFTAGLLVSKLEIKAIDQQLYCVAINDQVKSILQILPKMTKVQPI